MPVSPARRLAYQVLRRVEDGREFAADLLRAAPGTLSEADRRLATELVLGTLRRRAELDECITSLSGKRLAYFDPEVATILRLGAYQIRFLDRIPKSAAVHEAVEMTKAAHKRSAAGLVNAVLRKCEPASGASAGTIDSDALRLALPDWLRTRWEQRFGAEATLALARWSLETPPTVVRIVEGCSGEVQAELAAAGITTRPANHASGALVVEHGNVMESKPWLEGRIVIQEEASQLVATLLKPRPGQRVLDLCTAPGMKAAQIGAELGQGLVIACDRSARRLRSMVLGRLMPSGVQWHSVRLDAAAPLPFALRFDRILLDAPCSGTGTLARNPEIKWRLQPSDVDRFAAHQARMLGQALEALAADGRLVYATCSLEPEENEQVVNAVLAQRPGFRVQPRTRLVEEWPHLARFFDEQGYFRSRPDLDGTDGFFAAVIERGKDCE